MNTNATENVVYKAVYANQPVHGCASVKLCLNCFLASIVDCFRWNVDSIAPFPLVRLNIARRDPRLVELYHDFAYVLPKTKVNWMCRWMRGRIVIVFGVLHFEVPVCFVFLSNESKGAIVAFAACNTLPRLLILHTIPYPCVAAKLLNARSISLRDENVCSFKLIGGGRSDSSIPKRVKKKSANARWRDTATSKNILLTMCCWHILVCCQFTLRLQDIVVARVFHGVAINTL
ncbi:hypothetical protein PsorP6_014550 [Peronosclerospora sorghi]|uniref:Uncharacterized protein n=1 Tax=Peronosclerospora sorghi TaxID=230839 RepID=A0ACC0VQY5_9STRA|nr:hypothetical protein PsorP6_014550 [Peronosclerospora sorghi]